MVKNIAGQGSAARRPPLKLTAPVQPKFATKRPRTLPSPLDDTHQHGLPKKKLSFLPSDDDDERTPIVYDKEKAKRQQMTMTNILPPHHNPPTTATNPSLNRSSFYPYNSNRYSRQNHWQRNNNNSYLQRSYTRSSSSVPIGVKNLGNTCYLSAVLQVLSNLTGFHGELQHAVSKLNLPIDGIASILLKCSSALQSSTAVTALSPADLKKVLEQRAKLFEGFLQQDAHEALCNLLDGLQEEILLAEKHQLGYGAAICAKATLDPCTKIFSLAVERTAKCVHCGEESCATEQYSHLSLELSNNYNSVDITQLLTVFFKQELVDKTCDKCKSEMAPHTVDREIVRAPRVLALHLKRFKPIIAADGTFERVDKVACPVEIPDVLTLDSGSICSVNIKPPLQLHDATAPTRKENIAPGSSISNIEPLKVVPPPLPPPSSSSSLLVLGQDEGSKSPPVSPCVLPGRGLLYDHSNSDMMMKASAAFPSRLAPTYGMLTTPTSATAAPPVEVATSTAYDEEAEIQRALEASLKPQTTLDDLAAVTIEEGLFEDDLEAAIAASLAQVQAAEKVEEQPRPATDGEIGGVVGGVRKQQEQQQPQEQRLPSSPPFAPFAAHDDATPTFNRVPGVDDYTTNNDNNDGGMQQQVAAVTHQHDNDKPLPPPSVATPEEEEVEEDANKQQHRDLDIAYIVEEDENAPEGEKASAAVSPPYQGKERSLENDDGNDLHPVVKFNNTTTTTTYKLQSIINHEGFQATSGHFTADIKDEKTALWHHFSDSYVSPLSSHAVHGDQKQKECFIVFYTINM